MRQRDRIKAIVWALRRPMAAAALLLVMFLSLMNTGGMHDSEAARLLMGLQALTGIPYDLCVHFAMYAYLGVTFWIAFVWRRITRGHMALIWGALTLWGIAMECLQGWGSARGWWSRSFSYADMAANSLGAAAGVAVAWGLCAAHAAYRRRRPRPA